MRVLKFGGSSVSSSKNIKSVVNILENNIKDDQIIVVFSAIGNTTNLLLSSAKKAENNDESFKNDLSEIENNHYTIIRELISIDKQSSLLASIKVQFNCLENILKGVLLTQELTNRVLDKVLSYGELISSSIIAEVLINKNINIALKDSSELIKTNSNYGNAKVILDISYKLIKEYFEASKQTLTVLPGFISSNEDNIITTLGRGGSDYTASIFASALDVKQLEIWTDVNGIYTANPKIVKQAYPTKNISYSEALELSHFGASVLYPPTIKPVFNKKIPVYIKNTFNPSHIGTLISDKKGIEDGQLKGISHIDNISLLTIEGIAIQGTPGFSKRVLGVLGDNNINVILITQASSEYSICIAIDSKDAEKAKRNFDDDFTYELSIKTMKPIVIEYDMAIIALVGEGMKEREGTSGKMFGTLGKNNINIRAIAQGASERNISVVIDNKNIKKALNSLHECFFETHTKQLNLFVTGVGNVGGKLIEQIRKQQEYLRDELHLQIKVVALSNSKKILYNYDGIDLDNWKQNLIKADDYNINDFLACVKKANKRNSIFIDNTASEIVSEQYIKYLENNISVVTCNKIACASQYGNYKSLKSISIKNRVNFLFETNVGAGLPIINTLNNLISSGDRIRKIEAVLSGSHKFIFKEFKGNVSFREVVTQAMEQGYTEPDPRIDLSGIDVARKILILARESGSLMEIEEIENDSFLPIGCQKTNSVDDFYKKISENEFHFDEMKNKAKKEGKAMKYVASFEKGKAKVGLQYVDKQHPFYNLEGKDNIVLFYTDMYKDQPLIIKGAGAGAEVTASGLFADIIRIGNKEL